MCRPKGYGFGVFFGLKNVYTLAMLVRNRVERTTGAYERRPVAGGGAGGPRAPPEIFRLELNSATKVEFFY